MDKESIQALRREYAQRDDLDPETVNRDPVEQFRSWFGTAVSSGLAEPNAMVLATVGDDGRPAARMVLLKDFSDQGFVFYTNYESRKGRELLMQPRAALLFYWTEFNRQVRIEGAAEKVAGDVSDAYFQSRPRGARISAAISPQSQSVPDREFLEKRVQELDARVGQGTIERPAHWGGMIVRPDRFEFWQGRENRLHDRVAYIHGAAGWELSRLAP